MIRHFIVLCVSMLALALPVHAAFEPVQFIPADNSEVASLSTITVKWPGEWLEGVSSGICGKVEDENGQKVADLTCEENYSFENAACDLVLSEKLTKPGIYNVFVDADAVLSEDEEGSQAFRLKYKIVDASQQTISLLSADPEDNSIVPVLKAVKTFWSEKISTVNTDVKCEVQDSNGAKVSDVTVNKGVFSTDPVTFSLVKAIESEGTYKVVVPAGLLETEDGIKSASLTLTYVVNPSAAATLNPLSFDPENNSVISRLDEFTIVWDTEFDFDFEAYGVGKVTDELGITVATINCMADFLDEDTLVFELSETLLEEGEYTVVIDAGAITDSKGAKNDEIILTYIIDPSKVETNLKYWIDPSPSKFEDDVFPDIEFLFDEEIELTITEFAFTLDNGKTVTVTATLSDYPDTVTFDCANIKEGGTWTLTVPEGAFKSLVTGSVNPENTYSWEFVPTSTGIENIGNPDNKLTVSGKQLSIEGYNEVTIVDLSGNTIVQSAGKLNVTLDPGIYLIRCVDGNNSVTYKVII